MMRSFYKFEQIARDHIPYYSSGTLNRRFVAVRDLISQEHCGSARLRRLEEGIAKAAGVTLPPYRPELPEPGDIGGDWRAFTATCQAATYPSVTNNAGAAADMCVAAEAAASELGIQDVYDAIRDGGLSASPGAAGSNWPDDIVATWSEAFTKAYGIHGDRRGTPEVQERYLAYNRDTGN